jgi:hypothetical protein
MPRTLKTASAQPIALEGRIHTIRGQRVMLDEDLAVLYGVPTKVFNQAVKRNLDRFPSDFRFQLTSKDAADLRSQSVTSKGRGGRRYAPYAFTEQGVAMLSGVLNSQRAIAVNIEIMRAFIRLRAAVTAQAQVLQRLGLVEAQVRHTAAQLGQHKTETDQALKVVFQVLKRLAQEESPGGPVNPSAPIGFDLA